MIGNKPVCPKAGQVQYIGTVNELMLHARKHFLTKLNPQVWAVWEVISGTVATVKTAALTQEYFSKRQ